MVLFYNKYQVSDSTFVLLILDRLQRSDHRLCLGEVQIQSARGVAQQVQLQTDSAYITVTHT